MAMKKKDRALATFLFLCAIFIASSVYGLVSLFTLPNKTVLLSVCFGVVHIGSLTLWGFMAAKAIQFWREEKDEGE